MPLSAVLLTPCQSQTGYFLPFKIQFREAPSFILSKVPPPDKADSPLSSLHITVCDSYLYSPNYAWLVCSTLGASTGSGPGKGYSHGKMDTKHKLIMLVTDETREGQQVSVCCGHGDFVIGTSDISGHSTDLVQADSSCSFPLCLVLGS